MQGLRGSFQGPIYCSEITRVLLRRKWPELPSVKPLPLLETVSVRLNCQAAFSVTTFQASHCPGSVMFLFETAFQRILHTGDFRLGDQERRAMIQHPAMLSAAINLLFLDNTYCNPRFDFPCRTSAISTIIDTIQQHSTMRILVGIDLVGKEDMLVAIASVTGEKVGIDHNRLMTVVAAGFDARHFTLDLASGQHFALPRWMVCCKLLAKLNRTTPTLGIKLSGSACLHTSAPADLDRPSFQAGSSAASRQTRQLPHSLQKTQTNQAPIGPKPPEDSLQYFANFVCSHDAKGFRAALNRSSAVTALEQEQAQQLMKLVPYSDHSSFPELESFVAFVRPQAVVPIVKSTYNQGFLTDPKEHFKHLLTARDTSCQMQLSRWAKSRSASAVAAGHRPHDQYSQVHCWQKVHQRCQSSNKRHRIQVKTGTNKACIISASLSGTLGNPIIIDD
ncbi:hypothetical protein WJX82_006937 [Trebouxia sp. C0006]